MTGITKKHLLFAGLFSVFCLAAALGQGVTIYVDAANAGSPTMDGSELDPWDTISKGVTNLVDVNSVSPGGHTVLVKAGTYNERVDVTANASGVEGNLNTILADGVVTINNGYPIVVPASYIIIDGFILTGNALGAIITYSGFSNSIIRNCVFPRMGASETRTSGIFLQNSGNGLLISNCFFRTQGTGLLIPNGNPVITIADSVFYNIQCWALALYNPTAGCQITVTNSIFIGTGAYAFYKRTANGKFIANNNIIWGSGSANVTFESAGQFYNTEAEINALNTDHLVFSNNIVADPRFRDASGYDLRLASDSPCVDAGSPTTPPVDLDLYSRPRKAGNEVDIGSYELPVAGVLFMSF